MTISPLVLFPLAYIGLSLAMGIDVVRRYRAGLVHGWQLALTLLMKLVPIVAFAYVVSWRATTGDEVGAYFMFAAVAIAAGVLGVAWLLFDLVGLGVFRRADR